MAAVDPARAQATGKVEAPRSGLVVGAVHLEQLEPRGRYPAAGRGTEIGDAERRDVNADRAEAPTRAVAAGRRQPEQELAFAAGHVEYVRLGGQVEEAHEFVQPRHVRRVADHVVVVGDVEELPGVHAAPSRCSSRPARCRRTPPSSRIRYGERTSRAGNPARPPGTLCTLPTSRREAHGSGEAT